MLNFISWVQSYLDGSMGGGGGGVGTYSAKVFICFHGNHEKTRECACEIVFIEDRSD